MYVFGVLRFTPRLVGLLLLLRLTQDYALIYSQPCD
jgi:hypothetical protein